MFILKIKREVDGVAADRSNEPTLHEETDLFIEATEVQAGGWVGDEDMAAWGANQWEDHRSSRIEASGSPIKQFGRLIQINRAPSEQRWLVVSSAWLLNERTGDTLERLA